MTQRVYALREPTVRQAGASGLAAAANEGFTLLALDSYSALAASRAGLEFTTIDDWLELDDRGQAISDAYEWAQGWFAANDDDYKVDGICWPDFDFLAMIEFWTEFSLQVHLGRAFISRGVGLLRFTRSKGRRPSTSHGPADTFGAYWQHHLSSDIDVSMEPTPVIGEILRDLPPRARRKLGRIYRAAISGRLWFRPPALPVNALILAATEGESERFTEFVSSVKGSGLPVAAILLEHDRAMAINRSLSWGIPVSPGLRAETSDVGKVFLDAVARTSELSKDFTWGKAFAGCEFHFAYYARTRWPELVKLKEAWDRLWSSIQPRAVITSSLETAESQLPAETAKRAGIRSIAIPHAGVHVKHRGRMSAETLLYSNPLQGKGYAAVGVPDERLRPCRGVVMAHEYPLNRAVEAPPQGAARILALFDAISYGSPGRVLTVPLVCHREQLVALGALKDQPAHLNVDLRLKVHPAFPDLELVKIVGGKVADRIVPLDADLNSLLRSTDLVVSVNYVGSALIEAARLSRPTILLWTSPMLSRQHHNPYPHFFREMGLVLEDSERFWDEVAAFLTDGTVRSELGRKIEDFAARMIADEEMPSPIEVLHDLDVSQ